MYKLQIALLYILFAKINYIRKNTMFLFCEFVMSHAGKVGDYLKLVTIYIYILLLFVYLNNTLLLCFIIIDL